MKKLVVLSGAGISAESGISTFRDADGLWENHRIEDVASPIGWHNNMDLVLEFYNLRRKQLFESEPNAAHYALVELEKYFDVEIITQNVDDLHERSGSSQVLHLHGELKKVRSMVDENLVYELKHWELKKGDLCEKGSQLRPHIVWFGEMVPAISKAVSIVQKADVLLIIGTSMLVYPAAGLVDYAPSGIPIFYIDPKADRQNYRNGIINITEKAGIALPQLVKKLIQEYF
jgi:NAD-dependent deacetylase